MKIAEKYFYSSTTSIAMTAISSSAKASQGSHSDRSTEPNPLLIGRGLPPFEKIKAEQVEPGIESLIQVLGEEVRSLENTLSQDTATWESLVTPLTAITERLGWSWGIIGHLMGVKNSPELRAAYESVQPALVQFSNDISQSQAIYKGLKQLREGDQWTQLSATQRRIIEAELRDAELSGVGLSGEAKEKFNEIQQALAELSTQFSNHVLDATKAFSLTLTQPEEVAGLPPSLLSLSAQAARDAGRRLCHCRKWPLADHARYAKLRAFFTSFSAPRPTRKAVSRLYYPRLGRRAKQCAAD